jgi:hypothetical protein
MSSSNSSTLNSTHVTPTSEVCNAAIIVGNTAYTVQTMGMDLVALSSYENHETQLSGSKLISGGTNTNTNAK